MRRFILIDPCLSDIGSHPYHYALDVLEAASRAGFACEAVANRRFLGHADHWPPGFRLEAVLDQPGHSKYTAFGELDRLTPRGRPRMRLAAPWAAAHARRRRAERIEAFATSIEPVVRRAAPGDLVLLATATELDVAGLARAIRGLRAPRGIAWHALFHYPLYRGVAADFPRQEQRIDRLRGLFAQATQEAAPHRIHLHTTTEELAAEYGRLGVATFTAIPYPVRPVVRGPRVARPTPLRVAALGDARPEKHSHLLADVAELASDDPELAGRLVLAVQSNPGFPPESRTKEHRAVLEGIHRLASVRPGMVELLGGPLSSEAYAAQFAAADATMLAYDQDRYRCRCSGVLLESLVSGVVPIVTGGGWMARMLAEPMQRHADEIVSRSTPLGTTTIRSIRSRRSRPWTTVFERPGEADAIVIRLVWTARGDEALHAPPARVEAREGDGPATVASISPDMTTGCGVAILPLPRGRERRQAGLRLSIHPGPDSDQLDVERAVVHLVGCATVPPRGAVGIVVAPGPDLVDSMLSACRELVTHADHYRRSAAAHAVIAASRFSGDRLVEALTAVGDRHVREEPAPCP